MRVVGVSFHDHSCVSVLCDDCSDNCWDDGMPHFADSEEATNYLKSADWLLTETRMLCRSCAQDADCAATGHQFGHWGDREYLDVPYRLRRCDHCDDCDYDPPWEELLALREAALIVNRAGEAS